MSPQTIAIVAGQARTILAALLGVAAARFIPAGTLNVLILSGATLALCAWSIWQKEATAQSLFQTILGAARNLLAVALTYAASKGWIGTGDVPEIVGAVGTLAVMAWSADHKVNTIPAAP